MAKRVIDVAVAMLALALLSPMILTVALAIKISSPGPVLFKQRRVGRDGVEFDMWKFRSMVCGAGDEQLRLLNRNEASGPVFKIRRDPRVTPVGRWIRRTSIDELPQLWNVLCGHMSLVGPRPPVPLEVATYSDLQRQRLSVTPGITCIWQVSGRSDLDFDTWVSMDLEYIENWSLLLDLRLLLKTVPAVLSGRGAY